MIVFRDRCGNEGGTHEAVTLIEQPSDRGDIPDDTAPDPARGVGFRLRDGMGDQVITQVILSVQPVMHLGAGCDKGTDYTQKDSMVNLAMDVDKDVVFLVDKPSFGNVSFGSPIKNASVGIHSADSSYISAAKLPFNVKVYVYDTQNKEDKVFGFAGDRDLAVDVYSNGKATAEEMNRRLWNSTESAAESAGQVAAKSFVSTWHQDQFFVIYYDAAESAWTNGAEHANSFKWKEAIDDWLPLTKNKNKEKRLRITK